MDKINCDEKDRVTVGDAADPDFADMYSQWIVMEEEEDELVVLMRGLYDKEDKRVRHNQEAALHENVKLDEQETLSRQPQWDRIIKNNPVGVVLVDMNDPPIANTCQK